MSKILLIDDNKNNQKIMKKAFEKIGNIVETSVHGDRALVLYENFIPDLVIINFTQNLKNATYISRYILEFDATACIFGICPNYDLLNEAYAAGFRGIIRAPINLQTTDMKDIIDQLNGLCSEIGEKNCADCWETHKFNVLEPTAINRISH